MGNPASSVIHAELTLQDFFLFSLLNKSLHAVSQHQISRNKHLKLAQTSRKRILCYKHTKISRA